MLKDRQYLHYNLWILRIVSGILAIVLIFIIVFTKKQIKAIDEQAAKWVNNYNLTNIKDLR